MVIVNKYFNNLCTDIINKAKKIKLIISDVDGVLTDGSIFIDKDDNDGLVRFSVLDGMGIIMAKKCGINFAVISGRSSTQVEKRCKKIKIDHIYLGVKDKTVILHQLKNELNLNYDNIAYIGDDINDLRSLELVGLKVAPPNASYYILKEVDYITNKMGGFGAVRELIDLILESQNILFEYLNKHI